jgi:hypothetical protein
MLKAQAGRRPVSTLATVGGVHLQATLDVTERRFIAGLSPAAPRIGIVSSERGELGEVRVVADGGDNHVAKQSTTTPAGAVFRRAR